MEAKFYTNRGGGELRCDICPHRCIIHRGENGKCGVRSNKAGKLECSVYGLVSAFGTDPVEKKPLYHFYPGRMILSVGSYGCNMSCIFCQNHTISQVTGEYYRKHGRGITAEMIVEQAIGITGNLGIAFTYNEPVVWYEYMYDTAVIAKEKELKTVMVSNGYINPAPLGDLMPLIDAFNIDLKSFDNDFYRQQAGAGLAPVKKSIEAISRAGKHLEITMLIIPGLNDDPDKFRQSVSWISNNAGRSTPLHLSRYFPSYRLAKPATPTNLLEEMHEIASSELDYVYIGNLHNGKGQDTICPSCGSVCTKREGYRTTNVNLSATGSCKNCGHLIYEHFIY